GGGGVEGIAASGDDLVPGLGGQPVGAGDGGPARAAGGAGGGFRPGRLPRTVGGLYATGEQGEEDQEAAQGAGRGHRTDSRFRRSSLARSSSRVSGCAGSGRQHSTGQTAWHCGSSKWPTHSV